MRLARGQDMADAGTVALPFSTENNFHFPERFFARQGISFQKAAPHVVAERAESLLNKTYEKKD